MGKRNAVAADNNNEHGGGGGGNSIAGTPSAAAAAPTPNKRYKLDINLKQQQQQNNNHYRIPSPENIEQQEFVLTKDIVDGKILIDLNLKKWRIGKPIGKGSFGEIFLASDIITKPVTNDNAKYVVKIEPHTNGPLFVEIHCLLNAGKSTDEDPLPPGIPEFIGSGSHYFKSRRYRFLILKRFEFDLHSIIKTHRLDEKNILIIAYQLIEILQHLHDKGYAHSDIKAENLMIGKCSSSSSSTSLPAADNSNHNTNINNSFINHHQNQHNNNKNDKSIQNIDNDKKINLRRQRLINDKSLNNSNNNNNNNTNNNNNNGGRNGIKLRILKTPQKRGNRNSIKYSLKNDSSSSGDDDNDNYRKKIDTDSNYESDDSENLNDSNDDDEEEEEEEEEEDNEDEENENDEDDDENDENGDEEESVEDDDEEDDGDNESEEEDKNNNTLKYQSNGDQASALTSTPVTPATAAAAAAAAARLSTIEFSGSNPIRSCRMQRRTSMYDEMLKSHYLRPSKKINYCLATNDDDANESESEDDDEADRYLNKRLTRKVLNESQSKSLSMINESVQTIQQPQQQVIKTEMITEYRIILIDFGLASKFIDSYGHHRPFCMDQRRAHDGTLEFTSRDAHMGAHSRRSDLECFGYNLIYWCQGTLPWKNATVKGQPEQVHRMKEYFMTDVKEMLKLIYGPNVPKYLGEFLEYVGNLSYDERPDYVYCKNIFLSAYERLGYKKSEMKLNINELREFLKVKQQQQQQQIQNNKRTNNNNKLNGGGVGKHQESKNDQSKIMSIMTNDNVDGQQQPEFDNHIIDITNYKSLVKLGLKIPFQNGGGGGGGNGNGSINNQRTSPKNLRSKTPKKQRTKFSWTEILSTDPDQIARKRAEKEFERDIENDAQQIVPKFTGNPTYAILELLNKRKLKQLNDNHNNSSNNNHHNHSHHNHQQQQHQMEIEKSDDELIEGYTKPMMNILRKKQIYLLSQLNQEKLKQEQEQEKQEIITNGNRKSSNKKSILVKTPMTPAPTSKTTIAMANNQNKNNRIIEEDLVNQKQQQQQQESSARKRFNLRNNITKTENYISYQNTINRKRNRNTNGSTPYKSSSATRTAATARENNLTSIQDETSNESTATTHSSLASSATATTTTSTSTSHTNHNNNNNNNHKLSVNLLKQYNNLTNSHQQQKHHSPNNNNNNNTSSASNYLSKYKRPPSSMMLSSDEESRDTTDYSPIKTRQKTSTKSRKRRIDVKKNNSISVRKKSGNSTTTAAAAAAVAASDNGNATVPSVKLDRLKAAINNYKNNNCNNNNNNNNNHNNNHNNNNKVIKKLSSRELQRLQLEQQQQQQQQQQQLRTFSRG